jgi:polysaccharide export outer membrane protein
MTVLDAVLAAGGVTEFAAPDRSSLHRVSGDTAQNYGVQLDHILKQGDLSTNYKVAPGDVITVPERVLVNNGYRQLSLRARRVSVFRRSR